MTGLAPLLFVVIDPTATYWAYGFPTAIAAVFGADFIFASGSLFVAKVARPDEQSVAGGLFNTLAQVCEPFPPHPLLLLLAERMESIELLFLVDDR